MVIAEYPGHFPLAIFQQPQMREFRPAGKPFPAILGNVKKVVTLQERTITLHGVNFESARHGLTPYFF